MKEPFLKGNCDPEHRFASVRTVRHLSKPVVSVGIWGTLPFRVLSDVARQIEVRLIRMTEVLLLWQERARQRRDLDALSDNLLKDIGLTRTDIHSEVTKRFWQS